MLSHVGTGEKIWSLPGYILLERIALGGRGEVYLAREGDDQGPLVAVKVLRPEDASRQDRVQAFLDEVAISSLLIHPNIVRVYHGDIHDGLPYLVMEHVDGLTLWDLNERARMVDRRVPFEIAASMAGKTAEALRYAHELTDRSGRPLNLVHRDVSAVNVMATFDGAIKLLDFGIARFKNRRQQTAPGIIKGKLDYLSPEQCEGGTIDAVTDIYSLGVLLFELCTGMRPFTETDVAKLFRMVSRGERPRVRDLRPDVPPRLEQIIDRAMATKRKHRYPSAGKMLEDLDAFTRSYPTPPTSTSIAHLMIELAPDKVRKIADTYGPPETTAVSKAPPIGQGEYIGGPEDALDEPTIANFDVAQSLQGFSEDEEGEATQIDPRSAHFGRSGAISGADTVVEESPIGLEAELEGPPKNRMALIVLAILALFSLATLAGIAVTLAVRSRSVEPADPGEDPASLITGGGSPGLIGPDAAGASPGGQDALLHRRIGRVLLRVSPPGAKISFAGAEHAASDAPLPLKVAVGNHTLRVSAEGHEPAVQTVTVREGELTEVTLALQRRTSSQQGDQPGFLTVRTKRHNGMLYVGGNKVSVTPVERLELDPGVYDVSVRGRRGADSKRITLGPGEEHTVIFDL